MGKQAIEGKRLNGFYVSPGAVRIIGLDTRDGPEHPLYDERIKLPLDEGLVLSIMSQGVLKPILVRKNGHFIDVLAGRQRTRAAREANRRIAEKIGIADPDDSEDPLLHRLPLLLKSADGNDAVSMGAAENIHVQSDALTLARQAKRMLDRGLAVETVAISMGKSAETVYAWQKLLGLGEKMQAAVERGVLKPSAAVQYADMAIEEQEKLIADAEERGIIISLPEAKRQREDRKKTNGHATGDGAITRGAPISRTVIRKLLESEVFRDEVDVTVRHALAWVIGEPNMDRKIKGLRRALVDVGAIKPDVKPEES